MAALGVAGATIGLTLLTSLLMVGAPSQTSSLALRTHLTVSPGAVGAAGDVSSPAATCAYAAAAWHCSLKLAETARSNANATWTTSSSGQAIFSPSSGTLKPGTSLTVAAVISSCGGNYTLSFTGPQNTAQATFACG